MNNKYNFLFLLAIITLLSCKNESKTGTNDTGTSAASSKSKTPGDVSSLDALDHDVIIAPEGSKFFVRGFFQKTLAKAAFTVNKGTLHIKDGLLSGMDLNLDISSLAQIANRNEELEQMMKSEKAFDAVKFPNGNFKVTECTKALNDQQATHILKGEIDLHGNKVPYTVRVRVDYSAKSISINSDQIVIKASDLGIKMDDPSMENIYFSLTVNGNVQ